MITPEQFVVSDHCHPIDPGKQGPDNGKTVKGPDSGKSGTTNGNEPGISVAEQQYRDRIVRALQQEANQDYEEALRTLKAAQPPNAKSATQLKIAIARVEEKVARQPVTKFFGVPAD